MDFTRIFLIFEQEYPNARCSLDFKSDFELLIASRLSAQCTDEKVNRITPVLFEKFPDALSMSRADITEIEKIIKPCGLFRTKAKNLKNMCVRLVKDFNSKIPCNLEDLQTLEGIGRKTANLIMSEVFHVPSIVVDTHVSRVSRRIGFHNEKDPFKIELVLQRIIEKKFWSRVCHQMVFHGRKICKSRHPLCDECCINRYCKRNFI